MAEILLLMLALVWGTSYGVTKQALLWFPLLGFLTLRFAFTFLLLAPALWSALKNDRRACLQVGLPLGVLLWAIFVCETKGVALTSAANAAFLISLCIVLTPWLEWIFTRRRPDASMLLAALVCCLGTFLLVGGGLGFGAGDAWMLAAAILRALMVCLSQRLLSGSRLSSLAATGLQTGVAASLCALLWWWQGQPLPALPVNPGFWLALAYLVLFCTLFAFFVQNWAARRCSPSRVVVLTGSEPLFGALFASAVLGETLSLQGAIGGGLIFLATLWVSLAGKAGAKPDSRPKPAVAEV